MSNNDTIQPDQISQSEESERYISIKDLLKICVQNWYWFLISVVLCVAAGYYYTLKTEPSYLRTASLLVREEGNSSGAGDVADMFSSFGISTSGADVHNEILVIKSPIILEQVVDKLKLNISYKKEGVFRNSTLYGDKVPFIVELPGNPDNGISFKMNLENNDFYITDIAESLSSGLEEYDGEFKFDPEKIDTLSTPAGKIVVKPNANYTGNISELDMVVDVAYSSIYSAVEQLITNVQSTQAQEKADVINLAIEETSPARANDILNTLIKSYNEKWIQDRNEIARATSDFINERLSVIESELGNVDNNISDFKSKNLIPDVQAVSTIYLNRSEKNSEELFALTNQLQMAQYIKEYLNNPRYANSLLPVNSGVGSNSIETQIGEYNKAMLSYKSLLANSSEKNPIVGDLGKSIAESREAILSGIDNLIVGLQKQISSLYSESKQTNSKISNAPGQTKYLLSVERQQKVKEALYLYLLQKREENEVGQVFTPSNVRIISYARGSNIPVAPKRMNILLISFIAGLFIPFGIIFIYESLNDKVRSRSDLDNLSVPFLGDIPFHGKMRHRWERRLGLDKKDKQTGFVVKDGETNPVNEAVRIVRSNLSYMMKTKEITGGCKVVMVTSAIPHSGKTFITQNLGSAYAVKGRKVLLIDMDLRRHALSNDSKDTQRFGLANLLLGDNDVLKYIKTGVNGLDNLSILGSGPVAPNPTELLENGRLEGIISELKKHYDIILIDCPPLHAVSDTQEIAQFADMTVFVIRVGNLTRDYLPEVENIYRSGKYRNMAILLNGGSFRQNGSYGYGYGYGYGYK